MIHFPVAFALLLHVLWWGAGLAMLAMPWGWRRFWPVLVVPAGWALQSAVVWAGAMVGLKGTNSYALGSEGLPLVLLVVAWRRRDRTTTGLALLVAAAILGNAFVCGALSNPHDRYQNRVVWLALFTAVVGAVRLDQRFAGRRLSIIAENKVLADER